MSDSIESRHTVAIEEGFVIHRRPDGEVESVPWSALQAVLIETTDTGPFAPDVFWILIGHAKDGEFQGCIFPQGTEGDETLLERLQTLPGFDNAAFIEAMGSTTCQRFVLWERDKAEAWGSLLS